MTTTEKSSVGATAIRVSEAGCHAGAQGQKANHKCIYRLYRAEGLVVRRRRRKRLARGIGAPAALPQRSNQRWSMDFVSDCTAGGRTIRALTLVDDYTRECLAIEVDPSLGAVRVRLALEAVLEKRGKPEAIVVDHGPEFRGRALAGWSEERRVRLHFLEPGKPSQNCSIESFNGRLREECLTANWFVTLTDARRKIEAWRRDYNEERPHSSLGISGSSTVCAAGASRSPAMTKVFSPLSTNGRGLKRRPRPLDPIPARERGKSARANQLSWKNSH